LQQIKFKSQFLRQIANGQKTQTRRFINLFKKPYEVGDTLQIENSFIRLEITSVKCEFLQEISQEDAKREGFDSARDFLNAWDCLYPHQSSAGESFLVWVYEFKRKEA
jgi:hypothetical protein